MGIKMALSKKDLEEKVKEKVSPLLEETMERSWGITIPQIESDISDQLTKPHFQIYVPAGTDFQQAKQQFKTEFIKSELKLHRGNVSNLAKTLGIDRRSIHRAIKSLEINLEEVRNATITPEDYQRQFVDQTIRSTLDKYRELIQPQKMERLYGEVSKLSRNIAQVLPHPDLTLDEAEREFERQFLQQALQENNFEIGKTAKRIRIRAETLYRKIKKLGIKKLV